MIYRVALTIFLALTSAQALAHSEKESMTPADGAILDAVPETIGLRFNDGMRLTKVEMTHAETHTEALDLGTQWRGLGVDGHPMNGVFSFEVK